jgi:beta-lactamase class A
MRPLILFLISVLCAAAQPLEKAVRDRIAQLPATVSLYAKNLDTGATFGNGESEPLRTASTIKLPIMMAATLTAVGFEPADHSAGGAGRRRKYRKGHNHA